MRAAPCNSFLPCPEAFFSCRFLAPHIAATKLLMHKQTRFPAMKRASCQTLMISLFGGAIGVSIAYGVLCGSGSFSFLHGCDLNLDTFSR